MSQRDWFITILLIIIVPTIINYFTELTTPFVRLHLSRIAAWPRKRRLRILEEALRQARNFTQNTSAFYRYCLREAFMSICLLCAAVGFLSIFSLDSPPTLPPMPEELAPLKRLILFLDRSSYYGIGLTVFLTAARAAGTLSLIYSVGNFEKFEQESLAEVAILKEKIARRV